MINLTIPYQELKEQAIEAFTLEYLNRLLKETGGNVPAVAQNSGMKRQSLQTPVPPENHPPLRYRRSAITLMK